MEKTVWLVDAFTSSALTGNPAGVVPDAAGLSQAQMQAIASELHASETAFVLPPVHFAADLCLRYFTPQREVDLCGHATIGAAAGLLAAGRLRTTGEAQTGQCRIETNVGLLPVRYGWSEGLPWAEMGQAVPSFRDGAVDPGTAARMLGVNVTEIDASLPLTMSFTGLWDVFIPLRSLDAVARLTPDLGQLGRWNQGLGAASTHVYTRECVDPNHHWHARDFSPAVGVPEDPATGTATGALMALLCRNQAADPGVAQVFEQGFEIGRESLITARAEKTRHGMAVFVRGSAVVSVRGTIRIGDDL